MARNVGTSVENNFVNGLVTEATGLNFPENAVTDSLNCEFQETGNTSRRKGIDREIGFVEYTVNSDGADAFIEYLWKGVGGDGQRNFLVQQTGATLLFFQASGAQSISSDLVGTIDLNGLTLSSGPNLTTSFCQFAGGLGYLVVTHPYCEPFYVKYDPDDGTLTPYPFNIRTRDFTGVEPQRVPRLSTMTDSHHYNLANQGWSESHILGWYQKIGNYPSDFDVWWLYKSPDAFGTEQFLVDVAVAGGIVNNVNRGNSPAPKGSLVLLEFYQDRSNISGVPNIPVVTSGTNRPSTCAFHAGRIFYSGVNSKEYTSKIYFTQIIESTDQFEKCHQENDPTSQFSPDLLPTDGGVISIPNAGRIYKIWSTNNSLLVIASEGTWEVTGSQGIGFSATDYTVKRISSASTSSAISFVNVDGMPIWWGLDDIYAAVTDTRLGGISVQSLTEKKIRSFYSDIPESSRSYAKGAYNNLTKTVQWVYRTTAASSLDTIQDYDGILVWNTQTNSFSPWEVSTSPIAIRGISALQGLGLSESVELVTDLGVTVTVGGGPVTDTQDVPNLLSSQFKYTIKYDTDKMTYAQESTELGDWASYVDGGVEYPSFFESGYRIRGDANKETQANYVTFYGTSDPNSRFLVYGVWDYALNPGTVRWSSPQSVYITNQNYKYAGRKLKIRGHGKALQFRIENLGNSDFNIIGWSALESANSNA